jgi:hypothetical protein
MKTIAITVKNKAQEKLFFDLAKQLGIDITEAAFKSLTHKDAALGTSLPMVEDQLTEYLYRNSKGNPKVINKLRSDLSRRLSK